MPSLPFISNYCVSLKQLCIPLKLDQGSCGEFYLSSVPDDVCVWFISTLCGTTAPSAEAGDTGVGHTAPTLWWFISTVTRVATAEVAAIVISMIDWASILYGVKHLCALCYLSFVAMLSLKMKWTYGVQWLMNHTGSLSWALAGLGFKSIGLGTWWKLLPSWLSRGRV